jgi:hypothetical protein
MHWDITLDLSGRGACLTTACLQTHCPAEQGERAAALTALLAPPLLLNESRIEFCRVSSREGPPPGRPGAGPPGGWGAGPLGAGERGGSDPLGPLPPGVRVPAGALRLALLWAGDMRREAALLAAAATRGLSTTRIASVREGRGARGTPSPGARAPWVLPGGWAGWAGEAGGPPLG